MDEGRCGADISQVRQTYQGDDLGWFDQYESTCCHPAGHEGAHVFQSVGSGDEQQLHWEEGATHFLAYQEDPAAQDEPLRF